MRLVEAGLVLQTEGNVSERSTDGRFVVIKPSGVPYHELKPEHFVVVDMEGRVCEGTFKPSTDLPTHLELYLAKPDIGGIAHTHSLHATCWAQAGESLPCFGTTHADAFGDTVPVTRHLTPEEVVEAYERFTGRAILEVISSGARAVLVTGHGPFTFGESAHRAVDYAEILEKVARMALLKTPQKPLPEHVRRKHWERKHGSGRYYGQG